VPSAVHPCHRNQIIHLKHTKSHSVSRKVKQDLQFVCQVSCKKSVLVECDNTERIVAIEEEQNFPHRPGRIPYEVNLLIERDEVVIYNDRTRRER